MRERVSVSLDLPLELLREVPVGPECGVLRLLVKPGVPAVEFVEAVAEADTLSHSEVADVSSIVALGEACLVQIGE